MFILKSELELSPCTKITVLITKEYNYNNSLFLPEYLTTNAEKPFNWSTWGQGSVVFYEQPSELWKLHVFNVCAMHRLWGGREGWTRSKSGSGSISSSSELSLAAAKADTGSSSSSLSTVSVSGTSSSIATSIAKQLNALTKLAALSVWQPAPHQGQPWPSGGRGVPPPSTSRRQWASPDSTQSAWWDTPGRTA